jgi:hypothetical protein
MPPVPAHGIPTGRNMRTLDPQKSAAAFRNAE